MAPRLDQVQGTSHIQSLAVPVPVPVPVDHKRHTKDCDRKGTNKATRSTFYMGLENDPQDLYARFPCRLDRPLELDTSWWQHGSSGGITKRIKGPRPEI